MVNIPDKLYIGLIMGILLLAGCYQLFYFINDWLVDANYTCCMLMKPKLHLWALFVAIVVFRMCMVKWDRTETGRGILAAIMLGMVYYYFFQFQR